MNTEEMPDDWQSDTAISGTAATVHTLSSQSEEEADLTCDYCGGLECADIIHRIAFEVYEAQMDQLHDPIPFVVAEVLRRHKVGEAAAEINRLRAALERMRVEEGTKP